MIWGELPNQKELSNISNEIKKASSIDKDLEQILKSFPSKAHPMGILCSLTSALISFNPSSVDVSSNEKMFRASIELMAKFPILVSWVHRKINGLSMNKSDSKFSYTENLAQMMFKSSDDYKPNPIIIDALDKLLILHADHEQNCSTSTVRIVGSSHAGMYASISAGISALWGPLQEVLPGAIEMLEKLKPMEVIQKNIWKRKDKDDSFRLMGFGHRVYKNFDPRAKIIKKTADEVLTKLGINDLFLI